MKSLPLVPLDVRKRSILKAVVNDYVATAEPVGSHVLLERHQFGVKSATIRSEMAELAELGYLHQPHTSAGRVPTDVGYRFYVDRLMDRLGLPYSEAATVRDRFRPHRTELDDILEQTCRILSDLARHASMATNPSVRETVIRHVSVANVAARKILVVVVLDSGRVVHELLEVDTPIDPVRATNFLTSKLAGLALEALDTAESLSAPDDPPMLRDLLDKVLEFLKREAEESEETGIYLGGTSYILQQPEFRDAARLEAVLSALEQRKSLYRLFSSVYLGPGVTVLIGTENPVSDLRQCSFVGARYRIGGRVAGTIGVVGPTRMDYRRAASAVQYMARNLGELLTELSLA